MACAVGGRIIAAAMLRLLRCGTPRAVRDVGGHRGAAPPADDVRTDRHAVPEGDALIEDEAFALPQARLRRDRLQVFEDAAFEVIDLREALREHVS